MSLGKNFTVTFFGESHGECIGVVIYGCPAGLKFDEEFINQELKRRSPIDYMISTSRVEEDSVKVFSGVFNGYTTGAPICMAIYNRNVDSSVYEELRFKPRPGHADYPAYIKYAGFNDFRGGGIFSGRLTAAYVLAGAVAKMMLKILNIEVIAHTVEIAGIKAKPQGIEEIRRNIHSNVVRCADLDAACLMIERIKKAMENGDSVGGVIECIALNIPIGLGEPPIDTLDGDIAKALFAIPAVKGVEFGLGFDFARMYGSECNDQFTVSNGKIIMKTNNCGGILGGISCGTPIVCRAVIKPTPSIHKPQKTVDLRSMKETIIEVKGRHDVCIVPRAIPVVEGMVSIVLADHAIRLGLVKTVLR
ncbi:MAG: chorismate synthase [Candidatus Methanomethylicia archaeon]